MREKLGLMLEATRKRNSCGKKTNLKHFKGFNPMMFFFIIVFNLNHISHLVARILLTFSLLF
ncbi:hypothetical protein Lalb_Chr23g0276021 [Lupinus albus]|uniref:Uncharacterized protein n=1 Tax=Lupinus albus TaxID=3870 RepID=A0A6A4N9W8_LUPAL|nr:hypothetical protein Lalb_Chr23g0276021 [Lupinus albus]